MRIAFSVTLLFLSLFTSKAYAQDSVPAIDLTDKLREWFHKQPKPTEALQQHRLYTAILPIVGYNPAYGFLVGTGISGGILLGDPNTTNISSGLANINFTSKKQIVINLRTAINTEGNRWMLQGDYRLLFFSQPTYGLGTYFGDRPPLIGRDTLFDIPLQSQAMRFNYVRLYQTANRRVAPSMYIGLGYNLDFHFNIRDSDLDTVSAVRNLTDHFVFSQTNGFSQKRYVTSGIVLNGLWDSRDHPISSRRGQYANLSFRVNPKFLGSAQLSTRLAIEYKAFIPMNRKKPENVLGFWTWQSYQMGGEQPYLSLPSITWDMYNRSGRGYIQGRFRGQNFFYAESEYRFRILANGFLSGVTFLNITSASDEGTRQAVLSEFAPGYGVGLRVKMDKKTRTNISIDYGIGKGGASAIYFNLQEAF